VADHDDDVEPLACRVYTHARRHPLVIGNIQGLRIPPVTLAQLGIGIGLLVVLAMTRGLWAHLGSGINGLVLLGVPLGAAWSAKAVRMEGRAPWRAGLGWLQLWSRPRCGVRFGHRDAPRRPVSYRGRVWVAEIERR
jgi:hypothetical protein